MGPGWRPGPSGDSPISWTRSSRTPASSGRLRSCRDARQPFDPAGRSQGGPRSVCPQPCLCLEPWQPGDQLWIWTLRPDGQYLSDLQGQGRSPQDLKCHSVSSCLWTKALTRLGLSTSRAGPWVGPPGPHWRDAVPRGLPQACALHQQVREEGWGTGTFLDSGCCGAHVADTLKALDRTQPGGSLPTLRPQATEGSAYPQMGGLGPGWPCREPGPASLGLTAQFDKLCRHKTTCR